jgi:hypothetical protein
MESGRVALIRYQAPGGTRCVGSGLLIDERRVLTADHVAEGSGHRIECNIGTSQVEEILRSGTPEIDLAVLSLSEPVAGLQPLGCARVDRSRVGQVTGCVAIGFPRWRKDGDQRRSAQVDGWVPTAEGFESRASGLRAGWLTLVGERIPGAPQIPVGSLSETAPSPWGGMSGAAVVAGDLVIGVVRSHNLASGGQSLTVTPLTAIGELSTELQHAFWQALGVANPRLLPTLPDNMLARISGYLNAARIRADEHPYALGFGAPDLPTVYLHQKVSPQSGRESRDLDAPHPAESRDLDAPHPAESPRLPPSKIHVSDQQRRLLLARTADQAATHLAEALQRFDVQDILTQYRGAILVGGPGTGKSSLLRYLFHESSAAWLAGNDQRFVPVLVQALEMVGGRSFPEAVAHAVMADLGPLLDYSDLAELFATQPASEIPWLILLDGVDEILDREDREGVLHTIAFWWGHPRYRFLVTSRMLPPAEFQPLDSVNAPIFEIQQFNQNELPHFAERWFTGLGVSEVPNLVHELITKLAQGRLMQLACNPLIITMICVIFASDPDGALPRSRADLYERFITLLMGKAVDQLHELGQLQDRLRPFGSPSQDAIERLLADSRHLMEDLASHASTGTPAKESLIGDAEVLTEPVRPHNVPASVWRRILQEVLRQSGVVVERGDDFAFIHQTLMEYLAACASASKAPGWRDTWRLRIAAGRGDSRALFTVSVMYGKDDLIGKTPRILSIRRLVHARLVASLAYEGLRLPPRTVDVARERLASFAALRHNCIPDIARGDYEDDCVLAARSLALLDKERGLTALARTAADPTVAGFNLYGYSQLLGPDREHGLAIVAELASSSEMDSFDRVTVGRFVLGESRELGLQIVETLALDRTVESVFRTEMGFEVLGLDHDRGVRVLASLVADPLMANDRTECESVLARFDRSRYAVAMAALIANIETKLLDRFGTAARLMTLNREMALTALEAVAADSRSNGLARAIAAVTFSAESPSAGTRALRSLARDAHAPGFYRVFCIEWSWRISKEKDRLFDLVALASEPSLAGQWRVFAAEQLAAIDRELGLRALAKIRADVTVRQRWRLRALAAAVILKRKPTHWS